MKKTLILKFLFVIFAFSNLVACGGFKPKSRPLEKQTLQVPTPNPVTPPPTPSPGAPPIDVTCKNNKISLAWDAPTTSTGAIDTSILGYIMFIGHASGVYDYSVYSFSLTLTLNSLPLGKYFFSVKAFNDAGESPFSDEISTEITECKTAISVNMGQEADSAIELAEQKN